jgi:parallel beta helix pectate lyase-like protein
MMKRMRFLFLGSCLLFSAPVAGQVIVRDDSGFRDAVSRAGPGSRILIEPGEYRGDSFFSGLHGEEGKPIVIAARDPKDPPVFRGGSGGLHFSGPSWLEIEDLKICGSKGNGLNIDDAGDFQSPARHIRLRRIQVSDIGPQGNCDAIKLSGVDDFAVENCRLEEWGTGGSAIDMVGCHRGVIEGCTFRHRKAPEANGVQAKGGSRDIVIRRNRFEEAGGRAINLGGSTGRKFFRPPIGDGGGGTPERFEARDIRVEGNTFIGGDAAVAFVGVDGAVVRWNTIYRPRRWVLRILQENRATDFVPCRNGEFTANLVVFRSDELRQAVNIGPDTSPATFKFSKNFWSCVDSPGKSRPELPVAESGAVHGQDPRFQDAEKGDFRLAPESPARSMGAEAFR